ncbi:hypothetical protein LTSEJOH_1372, partial [Salmonella enterica subsp. enterica serovar Johannesburg str. S5-703]
MVSGGYYGIMPTAAATLSPFGNVASGLKRSAV